MESLGFSPGVAVGSEPVGGLDSRVHQDRHQQVRIGVVGARYQDRGDGRLQVGLRRLRAGDRRGGLRCSARGSLRFVVEPHGENPFGVPGA